MQWYLSGIIGMLCALLAPAHAQAETKFRDDVAFLQQHGGVVVLRKGDARLAVSPLLQARVMTSSAAGDTGTSFGWINRALISSGRVQAHINPYGGEDRIWLGPEGSQCGIFFKPGDPFDINHWQTPAPIDSEPFVRVQTSDTSIVCRKELHIVNHSRTVFDLVIKREVDLRDSAAVVRGFGIDLPDGVKAVAYSTVNTIQNTGKAEWTKEKGLLSIWVLSMFNATSKTFVAVPYKLGSEADLGPVVRDEYAGFTKVPATRLKDDDGVLIFRSDARLRCIGISPMRAQNVLGSYDPDTRTLTLVQFNNPSATLPYVNSEWRIQKDPYVGDVINVYNDGPVDSGNAQLGKFYEMETSSPALALRPGQSATHTQTTVHLQGTPEDLDGIAVAVLGRGLKKITGAFSQQALP